MFANVCRFSYLCGIIICQSKQRAYDSLQAKGTKHLGKKFPHQRDGHHHIYTFGTSALVERKVKADVQRQTAMMVIHDIDMCIDQMEDLAKNEEERNNAVQYILAHMDQTSSPRQGRKCKKPILKACEGW